MICIDLTVEDVRIRADRNSDGEWIRKSVDGVSGSEEGFRFSDEQMSAVVFLAILGDGSGPTIATLYPLAEKAVENWSVGCRPFP